MCNGWLPYEQKLNMTVFIRCWVSLVTAAWYDNRFNLLHETEFNTFVTLYLQFTLHGEQIWYTFGSTDCFVGKLKVFWTWLWGHNQCKHEQNLVIYVKLFLMLYFLILYFLMLYLLSKLLNSMKLDNLVC